MPLPMRMNPVAIVLKQLNAAATPKDKDFGESRSGQTKAYNAPITLRGQIVYGKKDAQVPTLTGDPGLADGHLCFRLTDLTALSVTLSKGDIVLSVADFPVNYKLIEVRPSGHLRGRANLIMAYFASNDETNPALRR